MYPKKGTLLIPSGPSNDPERMHLHVVCTDPCPDGKQLLLPICSYVSPCDLTCVLEAHEHTWLKKKSYVLYAKAEIVSCAAINLGIQEKKFIPKDDCNGQTFLKIKNGICNSKHTTLKVRLFFGCVVKQITPKNI